VPSRLFIYAEKGRKSPGDLSLIGTPFGTLGFDRISYYEELDLQTILIKFGRKSSAL